MLKIICSFSRLIGYFRFRFGSRASLLHIFAPGKSLYNLLTPFRSVQYALLLSSSGIGQHTEYVVFEYGFRVHLYPRLDLHRPIHIFAIRFHRHLFPHRRLVINLSIICLFKLFLQLPFQRLQLRRDHSRRHVDLLDLPDLTFQCRNQA